ncbi:hypothetical protein ACFYO9_37500 [Streptomyces sp. NPDC005863]|uniref:hypothetical protein n=1 Tax=Streptomyces sp. NPDC005863 TaxID=3364735 RepID=UPI0036C22552
MTTDPTAAVEVWARMLCAADAHVNDGDHIAWQQLPRLMQDDYRKAARWLMPRLAVAHPAAPSAPTATDLRDRIRRAICEADGFEWDDDGLEPDEYGEHADAVLAVLPVPADRAAVLREAADVLDTLSADATSFDKAEHTYKGGAAAEKLRRMADEGHQAERCTCTDAGPEFAPTGHYADCPHAGKARQADTAGEA